jgi:hypothetical protein
MSTTPLQAVPSTRPLQSALPYAGWVALCAGAGIWYLTGRALPDLFYGIIICDLVINMAAPWIIVPGVMIAGMWLGRSQLRGIGMIAGSVFILALCAFLLWGIFTILYHYGGWMLVLLVPVLASKINWREFFSGTSTSGMPFLMARSMLAPFACFAPATVICCLVLRRNTLGEGNDDWVGLFGMIYFSLQAGLDYLLVKWMVKKRGAK